MVWFASRLRRGMTRCGRANKASGSGKASTSSMAPGTGRSDPHRRRATMREPYAPGMCRSAMIPCSSMAVHTERMDSPAQSRHRVHLQHRRVVAGSAEQHYAMAQGLSSEVKHARWRRRQQLWPAQSTPLPRSPCQLVHPRLYGVWVQREAPLLCQRVAGIAAQLADPGRQLLRHGLVPAAKEGLAGGPAGGSTHTAGLQLLTGQAWPLAGSCRAPGATCCPRSQRRQPLGLCRQWQRGWPGVQRQRGWQRGWRLA